MNKVGNNSTFLPLIPLVLPHLILRKICFTFASEIKNNRIMYNIITSNLQSVKVNSTSVNNYSSKEIVEIIMRHNELVEISLKMKLWKTAAAHVRSISKILADFNIPVGKTYKRYNMKAILAEVNEGVYNPYSSSTITKCCVYSLHKRSY